MLRAGRVLTLLAVPVAALLAAGCGGTAPAAAEPAPPPSPSEPPPVLAPLTGLPVEDAAALDRPAVAVKVSDVEQAHPQVGLDRADIVFVEPNGVSYTRIAAVFHSQLPEEVGPVRSVRPVDAPLLSPMAPVFGNTMATQWVLDYVHEVGDLDDLGTLAVQGSGAYRVDGERPSPDHVFASPSTLLGLSERTAPPQPYLDHADDVAGATAVEVGGPGRTVRVPYGPDWDVVWTWDAANGRYLRDEPWGPHVLADGTRVGATNVLVLDVAQVTEKYGTGKGKAVPVPQMVDASGPFVALAGGRSVSGTWTKGAVGERMVLRTDAGAPLRLAPGTTWVELPSPDADVTTG